FFFQVEDGLRDRNVTGVQTCALPILWPVSEAMQAALHRPHCELLVTGTEAAWQQVCRAAAGARVVRPEPLAGSDIEPLMDTVLRSEERRVGKECSAGRVRVCRTSREV